MLTEKLMQFVRRQSELAAKVTAGTATDEEKAELKSLTETIQAATAPPEPTRKSTFRSMKLSEFQAHADQVIAENATEPDPAQLEVLRRNMESVKALRAAQPDIPGDHVITVEMLAKSDPNTARLDAIETGLDELKQLIVAGKGDGGNTDDGDGAGKQDDATAKKLALEAIDAFIGRFEAFKAKIESDSLKVDDIADLWKGEWDLRQLIDETAAVLAKLEEATKTLNAVMPKLKALDPDANDDGGDDGDDGKTTHKWNTGDLAKSRGDNLSDYRRVTKGREDRPKNRDGE